MTMLHHPYRREARNSTPAPILISLDTSACLIIQGRGPLEGSAFRAAYQSLTWFGLALRHPKRFGLAATNTLDTAPRSILAEWWLEDGSYLIPGIGVEHDKLLWNVELGIPAWLDPPESQRMWETVMSGSPSSMQPNCSPPTHMVRDAGDYVSMLHQGPRDLLHRSYRTLTDWAKREGLARKTRSYQEVYTHSPFATQPAPGVLLRFLVREDFSCV